ncbi:MAG: hypothetical protein SF097_04610 [Acidobacteriota bacterium]|nr:hypothetical protein [Acidobacteriota bacterium]
MIDRRTEKLAQTFKPDPVLDALAKDIQNKKRVPSRLPASERLAVGHYIAAKQAFETVQAAKDKKDKEEEDR